MVAEVNGPLAEHNSPLPLRLTSIGRLREGPHALGDVLASTRHGNLDSSVARNVGRYSGHIGPSQRAASYLRLRPAHLRRVAGLVHALAFGQFGARQASKGDGQGILISRLHQRYYSMPAGERQKRRSVFFS